MKQRIITDQIKQLTRIQEKKLLDLWKPELGDWVFDYEMDEIGIICGTEGKSPEVIHITWYEGGDSIIPLEKGTTLPLLSIGQMVELLYNSHTNITMEVGTQGFFSSIKAGVNNKQTEEELSDALWEATKKLIDIYIAFRIIGEK